jgi:hypothetical protein
MKPKVSDEIKAKLLARVYTDLMPDPPPPPPKPKLEAEVLSFPPILNQRELIVRQEVLDRDWERHLAAQRELKAEKRLLLLRLVIEDRLTLIGRSQPSILFGGSGDE